MANPSLKKIKDLDDLAATAASLRAENRGIVHCHGVFDLLHVGHIRHLEEAKKLGDVLVVTITPDIYVNKGPHRPAFPQELRAEAVAALNCVDYVAITRWPSAVETIKLLRPHFYVKGSDYKDAEKDLTGGIIPEEEAVESGGGQLAFTEDITFSSSRLINQHLPLFPESVRDYLMGFADRYSSGEVIGYLEGAKSLKVLVVGEAIIDEYQYCQAIGKSSKEAMLAVKRLSTEKFAGGSLAVANHIANFCDQVSLVTFLGMENSQEDFINSKLNANIQSKFLYKGDSPTIVKRRFVESYFFSKILEVYEINDTELSQAENEMLSSTLLDLLPQHDLVVVADFGHGMFSKKVVELVCEKASFLVVNAQSNAGNFGYHTISRYRRGDYVCMAEGEIRLEARDRYGDLRDVMRHVSEKLGCRELVVTRGSYGCVCFSQEEGFFEIPAFAGEVVDRMGAGDAFFSITALCAAQRAPLEMAGFIGNAIGAQAVATVGHRKSIERVPLFKQIKSLVK